MRICVLSSMPPPMDTRVFYEEAQGQPGEVRVMIKIVPERVQGMG